MSHHNPAADITRQAKSNLAFALMNLPPDRREAMTTYYAYCRIIDDIADEEGIPAEDRRCQLGIWRDGVLNGFKAPDPLQAQVEKLITDWDLDRPLMTELIDGCERDITPIRFGDYSELKGYCHQVASSVGMISIKLFGCTDPRCADYAEALGQALQLTNIMRDVGEDLHNSARIYLPLADLYRFQYTERDLIGRVYDGRFLALMEFQYERARGWFDKAAEIYAELCEANQEALTASEIMAEIYGSTLEKMRKDQFKVFDKRYSLSKARKLAILFYRKFRPRTVGR